MVETDCEVLQPVLKALEESEGVNMLSLLGILLIDRPLDPDDVDESLEYHNPEGPVSASNANNDTDLHIEVEDSLGELTGCDEALVEPLSRIIIKKIMINGKETAKA